MLPLDCIDQYGNELMHLLVGVFFFFTCAEFCIPMTAFMALLSHSKLPSLEKVVHSVLSFLN